METIEDFYVNGDRMMKVVPLLDARSYLAAQALIIAHDDFANSRIPDWQIKVWFKDRGGLTREEIVARAACEYVDALTKAIRRSTSP